MKALTVYLIAFLFLFSSKSCAQGKTLVIGKTIESPISTGERHTYKLSLDSGQYAHVVVEQIGIDLVISVIDPHGTTIDDVDSPTGAQGIENVMIEASASGMYQLEVHPFESGRNEGTLEKGNYNVRIKELLSSSENVERLEANRAQHQEVIQWLRAHAISLKGVEAEQGFDDMQPLTQIIGDARLVALGEATHGTREFFQLKHRMLEFLVTEMGFNIFGIEATMPEGFDVNEYVLTGNGDPEKALAGLYFWTWNTEEVLDMIRWMRRYNADPSHTNKIRFYGFDMQFGTRAVKVLFNYLNLVDKRAADLLSGNSSLALIGNPYTTQDFSSISIDKMVNLLEVIRSTVKTLDTNKEKYIAQSGQKSWEIVRLHGNILLQYIQLKTPSDNFTTGVASRDSSMAANIRWILEHEGPEAKMVIWAHNGHVATQPYAMGQHLRNLYGKEMIVFGFAFNQGSFQAIELPIGSGRGLRPFHVKPLDQGTLDGILGATGIPFAVINLKGCSETEHVAEWFSKPHETRSIGSVFSPKAASNFVQEEQFTELYDALLFIDETTAARPNPGGTRSKQRILVSPENLDFESGDPGLIPEGWNAHKYSLANFDFTVEISTDRPIQGNQSVKINREPGRHYGETFGSLSQRIEATKYSGKRIRLRAAVRTEVEGPGNQAYLWLSINKQGFGPQSILFKDGMSDRPITTSEWRYFEITSEVPKEAQWIDIGMAITGEGSAWFDALSLEIIDPKEIE